MRRFTIWSREASYADLCADRNYLHISYVLLALNTSIFLYLTLWLNYYKGNTKEWEVAAPWSIPTATVMGLIGTVT